MALTNTIVQLARFNSSDTPNNAEWTSKLREPIILNEGDTLSVRQAFVDSRLNSSTNIVIDADTELSLTYYFYVMMPCDKISWQEADVLDASSYAEDGNQSDSSVASWTWKWSAYDYVAFAGANGGTAVMERLQKPINTFETGRSYPVAPQQSGGGFWNWSTPINQCEATEVPMMLITNDIGGGKGNPMENTPITKTWTYTLKAGSYAPTELADLLTKNMAEIQTNKTNDSYSPYDLFGGSTPTNLNAFLQKGTCVSSVQSYSLPDPYPDNWLPDLLTSSRYTGDNLVSEGQMLFSSNSPAFAPQPQHTGVFSNFLVDTPFNTNYLDPSFYAYYGDYYTAKDANLNLQHTNPVMFMPSHYAGTIATATGFGILNQDPTPMNANWYRTYNSAVVGASEISLEFNPETSLFQFTYMHTPLMEQPLTSGTSSDQASEPIEVVKIVKTINVNTQGKSTDYYKGNSNKSDGEVKLCEQTRHSGIFFQSMEPIGFWQNIMGFDVPNITVPLDKVWGLNRSLTFSQFNKLTTSGYVGIENNFNTSMSSIPTVTGQTTVVPNKNSPSYISAFPTTESQANPNVGVFTYTQLLNSDQWILENYVLHNDFTTAITPFGPKWFYDYGCIAGPQSDFYEEYASALNATNPLQAIQIPLSQTNATGHYFVEIVGYNNNTNDFVNENSIYAIKSIVAAYYVSPNSFITQPFADTAVYQHIGDTQYINKFRIRLLDPLTMKPAEPLGPNSSVYLQLGRLISKLAMTQPV